MRKLIVNFLFFTLTLVSISSSAENPAEKFAPDFTLPLKQGSITLSHYKGKVVYLDFWASWCIPCRKSFPWMNSMEQQYSRKGLKIITVNLDKKKKAVSKFLRRYPAKFTVAYDPEGKTAAAFDVKGMPSSYLIDRSGKIIFSHIGFRERNKKELEKIISSALAK